LWLSTNRAARCSRRQDAWRWLHKEGGERFGVAPDRIAEAGGSAGGHLTLMTGFCVNPQTDRKARFE